MAERSAAGRGRWARNKGKAWERAVRRAYAEALGDAAVAQRTGHRQVDGDAIGDVTVEIVRVGTLHNECKVGAQPNIRAAMEQALQARQPDHMPIVVSKRDRETPLVTLRLDDWLAVLKIACEER